MADAHDPHPPRRRRLPIGRLAGVIALAAVIVLAGVLASLLGARAEAHSRTAGARLAFRLASTQIASTLGLALQHEEDLVVAASAFVAGSPRVSAAAFDSWLRSVRAMERYPELENVGLVVLVPASRLAAFRARVALEPAEAHGVGPAGAPFALTPPGPRPYYCLAVAGRSRDLRMYLPPGIDYCALAGALMPARESGQASYAPFPALAGTALGVQTPVYRGPRAPATPAARRQAFVGWLGELLAPEIVVRRALQGHAGMTVRFSYDSASSHVSFAAGGTPARDAQTHTIDLHNGWTVRAFGPPLPSGVLAGGPALTLLAGGSLLSLLGGLLIVVLATGRMRALAMVREKTRELSHLALHDPLTGVPNRTLVLDRAQLMLARVARRPEMRAGALYVDVDGFKDINDSHGHAVGDELICEVARRLRAAVRAQDTVGRFGGDEFVVLVEAPAGSGVPEELARRVTEALRAPVVLRDTGELTVTASVGAASGRYESIDALLRDADLALYAAKASGRDRYVLHEAAGREQAGTAPAV